MVIHFGKQLHLLAPVAFDDRIINRKLIALDMDEHMAVCYGSINTEGIFAVVDTLERPGLYPKLMESIKVWLEEE